MVRYRHGSPLWACIRNPQLGRPTCHDRQIVPRHDVLRLTTSFEYVGPPAHPLHAEALL